LELAANVFCGLVALIHIYIFVLETFLWHGRARTVFRMDAQRAALTAVFAANQGVYNGVLAAGMLWGIAAGLTSFKTFFAAAVMVVGVIGGVTVGKRILLVQVAPALLALLTTQAAWGNTGGNYAQRDHAVWVCAYVLLACVVTVVVSVHVNTREELLNRAAKPEATAAQGAGKKQS